MKFTRSHLDAFRGQSVPDLVGAGLRLLFVGINPGLWTAATQTHFAYPDNRFYPALHDAGITNHRIDAAEGISVSDRCHLQERGVGITNLVNRATARADELTTDELRRGATEIEARVAGWSPRVVAILGITAYRTAFRQPKAIAGRQSHPLGGAILYVLGNPSGLNAHETVASLARSFRAAAEEAGIDVLGEH